MVALPFSDLAKRKLVIIIGDSHYGSVAHAAESTIATDSEADYELAFFNAWKYGLNYEYSIAQDGLWVLNPELRTTIEELSSSYNETWIFGMFGGGHHNVLSLLKHPQTFDFILAENTSLPVEADSLILPEMLIYRILESMIQVSLRNTRCLKDAFSSWPVYSIESPPAIGDNKFVRSHLGSWFDANFSEAEREAISSPWLRYKAWRLNSRIYLNNFNQYGIEVLPYPRVTTDFNGFLLPEYYGSDSTHASASYGRLILDQIEDLVGGKFGRHFSFG